MEANRTGLKAQSVDIKRDWTSGSVSRCLGQTHEVNSVIYLVNFSFSVVGAWDRAGSGGRCWDRAGFVTKSPKF